MRQRTTISLFMLLAGLQGVLFADAYMVNPPAQTPDSTTQAIADIRAAERRRIPLDVQIKSSNHYQVGKPVIITIIVTNLFDTPLLMNGRMLVNHVRLPCEISFHVVGPDGKRLEIRRLITPLAVRDQDFMTLNRGESMQRDIDLSDLFGMTKKGIYKVQVSYHNEVDHVTGGVRAWKGVVISEPTEILLK